jgi:5-methylcytosine-specific restriction endonuclease McrA
MGYTKEQQKEYMKIYYKNKRQKILDDLGGRCVRCGTCLNLEVDHIDWRTKLYSISSLWSIKDKNVLNEELKKCQVLCGDCHSKKTRIDMSEMQIPSFTHGTIYAWMKIQCPCDVCLLSKRVWYDNRNESRRIPNPSIKKGRYGRPSYHGEKLHYTRGCRCVECRAANASDARRLRAL